MDEFQTNIYIGNEIPLDLDSQIYKDLYFLYTLNQYMED